MKYKESRECPTCKKSLYYSCKGAFKLAEKNNTKCKSCGIKHLNRDTNNVKILYEDNYKSLYWIGFILADGHIHNNKRLSVTLSNKDADHLKKLADYIKVNVEIIREKYCTLAAMDSEFIPRIVKKYNIDSNKTKSPPEISVFKNMDKDLLLALFSGFIDGDGCISNLHNRKDFQLAIKCHSSWINILSYFKEIFCQNKGYCKINNQGYAHFICGDTEVLKELKRKVDQLNLPLLKRKWDIIDLNFISRYEKTKYNIIIIKQRLKEGIKQKDIAKELGIVKSAVSLLIKRYNLK